MTADFIAYFAENVCIQNLDFTQFPGPLVDEIRVGNNEKRDKPVNILSSWNVYYFWYRVFHIQIKTIENSF